MIGALCIAFAPAFGRSVILVRKGKERQSRTIAWALRVIVTGAAVAFRVGFDLVTIIVFTLAILAFAAGAYYEWRPRRDEELDKIMFPRD